MGAHEPKVRVRCKNCKQIKTAEVELAKLQVLIRDQTLELHRLKKQVKNYSNSASQEKGSLADAMVTISNLSKELSKKGEELRKIKTELNIE